MVCADIITVANLRVDLREAPIACLIAHYRRQVVADLACTMLSPSSATTTFTVVLEYEILLPLLSSSVKFQVMLPLRPSFTPKSLLK